jgi:hypothetical protein
MTLSLNCDKNFGLAVVTHKREDLSLETLIFN